MDVVNEAKGKDCGMMWVTEYQMQKDKGWETVVR